MSSLNEAGKCIGSLHGIPSRAQHVLNSIRIFTGIVLIQNWPSPLLGDELTDAPDDDRCDDRNASGSCFQKHIGQSIVQACIDYHVEPLWMNCVKRTISAMPKQIGRL